MPRQPRPPLNEKQQAALAAGRAKAAEMQKAGTLRPGGKGGGNRRTDLPPEPESGPRAVVVSEPEPTTAVPAPPAKSRRITWPTPPVALTSAEPVTASADASAEPGGDPAPVGAPSTTEPPTPLPPTTPPRRGFLAGLLEGFSE